MVYEQININLVARRCEWKIVRCHQKGLFLSFRDVATGPDQGKYLMAPNAARKLFRIKPNAF